jgi:cytochrome P450
LTSRGDAVSRLPDAHAIDMSNHATEDFAAYFDELLDTRRRKPSDDLISTFAAAADEPGGPSRPDLLAMCLQLLSAGHLPAAGLLGNAVAAIIHHRLLPAVANPSLLPAIVEEAIRYDGPVQMAPKVAAGGLVVDGVPIPDGDIVMLGLASANRDARQFPTPDRFRTDRALNAHLSFGAGQHFCLGARLARRETRTLLAALAAHGGTIELRDIGWLDSFTLRIPERLVLDLGDRRARG